MRALRVSKASSRRSSVSRVPILIGSQGLRHQHALHKVTSPELPHRSLNRPPTRSINIQCMRSEMQADAAGSFDEFVTPKDAVKLSEAQLPLDELCELLHNRIYAFLDSTQEDSLLRDVQRQVKITLDVFAQAFKRYNLAELSLSYNGGKDCLILLILYLVSLHKHFQQLIAAVSASDTTYGKPVPDYLESVYIQHPNSFFEVDEFVRISARRYHLAVASSTLNMKEAFGNYLQTRPGIKAILIGTRRNDPHASHLQHFDRTDHGWPDFMRIQPVIDWHYREVWAFIRQFDIPYCSLYDQGYTSLGGTKDTFPNPSLAKDVSSTDKMRFRPAYELADEDLERSGRHKRDI